MFFPASFEAGFFKGCEEMSAIQKTALLSLYGIMFVPFYTQIHEQRILFLISASIFIVYVGSIALEAEAKIRPFLAISALLLGVISYLEGAWGVFFPLALLPLIVRKVDEYSDKTTFFILTGLIFATSCLCFFLGDVSGGSIMEKALAYSPLIFTMLFSLINIKTVDIVSEDAETDEDERISLHERLSSLEEENEFLKEKLEDATNGLREDNYLAVVLGLEFEGFDYESNVDKTVETLREATHAPFVAYYELNTEKNVFVLKKSLGTSCAMTKASIPVGIGIIGQTYTTQQLVYVKDIKQKERDETRRKLLGAVDAILAVPVFSQGKVVAAISLGLPELTQKKEEDILNLCCIVARKVGAEFAKIAIHKTTERKSITDKLTGVYNRQFFDVKIGEEFARAKQEHKSLAYVAIDLDFFKQMNDTHGHDFGDKVLIAAANVFKKHVRQTDYVFRQGGDEFSLLLLGADAKKAYEIAQFIRKAYQKEVDAKRFFAQKDGNLVRSSFSIGISVFPHKDVKKAEDLLKLADKAVYRVKENGKDNIAIE